MSEPRDFWRSCGHHFLDRDDSGRLLLTDEFLKAYLARPELLPAADACAGEQAIHREFLVNPRRPVAAATLAAIVDIDARDNWSIMLAWRDHLVRHPTLEAAYLDIVAHARPFPSLFIDQLVQVILRNILEGCGDAFLLRAAELFFRTQTLTVQEGALLSADEETVSALGHQPVSPLISLLGMGANPEIAVLSETNEASYWERSDQFDFALDLTSGRRGLAALGKLIRRWVAHLQGIDVEVLPKSELRDVSLRWYVGLDVEATRMGDRLWSGEALDEAQQARLLALYQLNFLDPEDMHENVRGAPTYLMMAMTQEKTLRLKPQNLLSGLPSRQRDAIA